MSSRPYSALAIRALDMAYKMCGRAKGLKCIEKQLK
jgi:hypothetical protein